jgi:hypothetical protein
MVAGIFRFGYKPVSFPIPAYLSAKGLGQPLRALQSAGRADTGEVIAVPKLIFMRFFSVYLLVLCLLVAPRLGAVYAPIPELEQGRALTVYLATGAYYDSNIFGAATQEIGSTVYEFNPSVVFNASVDAKTFVSASYRLTFDYEPDRPGKKGLDSHEFTARVAHTFTPLMELDLSDTYQIAKNPESLLPGTVLNTDQSYRRNQFDARYAAGLTKRTGLTFKGRTTRYDYENGALGDSLNHDEYLAGLSLSHAVLPELQTVLEYRHLVINYDSDGDKDKRSDFLLVGADRVMNARLALTSRLGFEHRRRTGGDNATLPYAELGLKYDYHEGSYVSAGYGYSVEETSNIDLYSDMSVNRFFVNLQQSVLPRVIATGSLTWEPSRLNGRPGKHTDSNETNTQLGFALIYQPGKVWSVSATFDYDRINSDDPSRQLKRSRTGLNVKYVF